jgi:hypothetical protein
LKAVRCDTRAGPAESRKIATTASFLASPEHKPIGPIDQGIQMKKRVPMSKAVMGLVGMSCGLALGFAVKCHAQQGAIVHTVMTAKAPAWQGMGIRLKRGLSVVTEGASVTIFGVGMDNALLSINSGDNARTWGALIDHGGKLASAPACATDVATKSEGIRCFYIRDGVLWSQLFKRDGTDQQASAIGDRKLDSDLSVALSDVQPTQKHSDIKLNYRVFVHDAADNGLWYADTSIGQLLGTWQAMEGKLKGGPSCLWSEGTTTCYVVGSDDAVWSVRHEGDHFAWNRVGGPAVEGVHAWIVQSAPVLAVRGKDSTLWVGRQNEDSLQWQWTHFPGEIASVPACSGTRCFALLPGGELGFLDL